MKHYSFIYKYFNRDSLIIHRDYRLLADYFTPSCESVFVKGLRLGNFVPPPPTATPTDAPPDVSNKSDIAMADLVTSSPSQTPRYYPKCHCAR